ncbi:hypothetical protein M8J77_021088 [Diaphorina citri]|nr:hypothetical protein M8J77_021088 [Diaphorina citri]
MSGREKGEWKEEEEENKEKVELLQEIGQRKKERDRENDRGRIRKVKSEDLVEKGVGREGNEKDNNMEKRGGREIRRGIRGGSRKEKEECKKDGEKGEAGKQRIWRRGEGESKGEEDRGARKEENEGGE